LFGCSCCIREWGRIGRPGQTREVAFPTISEAQKAVERQRRLKEQRGYGSSVKDQGSPVVCLPDGTS
jgi:predicted DNA-binding WGR domain protein